MLFLDENDSKVTYIHKITPFPRWGRQNAETSFLHKLRFRHRYSYLLCFIQMLYLFCSPFRGVLTRPYFKKFSLKLVRSGVTMMQYLRQSPTLGRITLEFCNVLLIIVFNKKMCNPLQMPLFDMQIWVYYIVTCNFFYFIDYDKNNMVLEPGTYGIWKAFCPFKQKKNFTYRSMRLIIFIIISLYK